MSDDDLDNYAYLWNGSEEGWSLLRVGGDYCIFNKLKQAVLLLEDDAVAAGVQQRMRDAGCEVLEGLSETRVSVTRLDS